MGVSYFQASSQYLLGTNKENKKKQSRQPVSGPNIELGEPEYEAGVLTPVLRLPTLLLPPVSLARILVHPFLKGSYVCWEILMKCKPECGRMTAGNLDHSSQALLRCFIQVC
jgi:hypothetical protein